MRRPTLIRMFILLVVGLGLVSRTALAQAATAGLGIAIAPQGENLVIMGLQPGGAAERSGLLKTNDRLLAVAQATGDAVAVQGKTVAQVGEMIRGPVDTMVRLTIQSPGDQAPRIVAIVRGAVNPLAAWGEPAPSAPLPTGAPLLPTWAVPRLAPMRTQGSYLVILPPDYEVGNRTYPVCVLLHGRGDNEQSFGTVVTKLGREGVIYVALRAPYPEIGNIIASRGPAYTTGPTDYLPAEAPQLDTARRDYVDWIFDAVADVRKNYRVREGKIFLYGYSQGGGMAHNAALLYPERIAAYFAQSGSAPWVPFATDAALQREKQQGVRVWMEHGREDDTVLLSSVEPYAARLRAAGVQLEMQVVPGGHQISDEMFAAAKAWVSTVVRAP